MISMWLRGRRKAIGIEHARLADQLGVSADLILDWESGCSDPNYQQLARLSERIGDHDNPPGLLFRTPFEPGSGHLLVIADNNRHGIGRLVEEGPESSSVAYVQKLQASPLIETIPNSSLNHAHLSPQTRVFLKSDDGRWRVGRIGYHDTESHMCTVELPDGKVDEVSERDLFLRSTSIACDPADVLGAKAHETGFFHTQRLALVKATIHHRSLTGGQTALVSSRIELHAHQVGVIQRVSSDPIQRYLLADEVGLGKTIEAGVLARQHLTDDPNGHVLIITPPGLVGQWKGEWRHRFALYPHDPRITIGHLDEITEPQDPTMLIVDEAHHVAGWAWSTDSSERASWQRVVELAGRASSLLLLTATPASSDAVGYLALLHLIDPDSYRLSEREKFATRVEIQDELGKKLLALDENLPPFLLEEPARDIREMLGGDPRIDEMVGRLQRLIDDDSDDVQSEVRDLRTWVSEIYRLHRRMLRSRRVQSEVLDLGRSEDRIHEEWSTDKRESDLAAAIEQWRLDICSSECSDDYADVYRVLLECASCSVELAASVASARLGSGPMPADLSSSDAIVLGLPLLPVEREALAGVFAVAQELILDGDMARDQLLGEALRKPMDRGERSVVFVSYPIAAMELSTYLRTCLAPELLCRRLYGMKRADAEADIARFESTSGAVLICDRSGEEGLNLQHAVHAIFYDLPFDPNRLEQRLGRLDRIGRRRELYVWLLPGPEPESEDPTVMEAWLRILRESLGFFRRSLAPIQLLFPRLMPEIAKAMFRGGSQGLDALVSDARAAVKEEEHRARAQDLIDTTDTGADVVALMSSLSQDDARCIELERAVDGWLTAVLQFKTVRTAQGRLHVPTERTLLPADVLLNRFLPLTVRPITFDRRVAAQRAGPELARAGHPLVDQVCKSLDWDDRGRAAVFRRRLAGKLIGGRVWVGFRFDWVLEADTDAATALLSRSLGDYDPPTGVLRRRMDALYTPHLVSSVVDVDGAQVDDHIRDSVLPFFSKRSDVNLHKDRLIEIDQYVPPYDLQHTMSNRTFLML